MGAAGPKLAGPAPDAAGHPLLSSFTPPCHRGIISPMNSASPYPPSVQELIEQFARLPGVGKRSAERMAYHILASPKEEVMPLAFALRDVKKNIRACKRCFNVAEGDLCAVCADRKRDPGLIAVVELPRDVIAIEKAGAWQGSYHVLQGYLDPAAGVGPEQLRVRELLARLEESPEADAPVREVVLALSPTTAGDATASYLAGELADREIKVTRLARGLASGADIESAAPSSIQFAIEGRREI